MANFKKLNEQLLSILQEENLVEMATVNKQVPRIAVNPSKDRNNYMIEYFKVYNKDSYTKADKVARIKFREPKYIIHTSEKKTWNMSKKEIQSLINELNKPSRLIKDGNYTLWHDAIIKYNSEAYDLDMDETLENKVENLKFPKALPINLPMPDYTKLK